MKNQKAKSSKENREKKQHYLTIPHIVVDSGLLAVMKPSEIKVYAVITRYKNFRTGWCFPSVDTISRDSGYNKNVVCKATKRLESYGLILKRRSPKTLNFRNLYKVLEDPEINFNIIPQKMEKRGQRVRGKDGKWKAAPQNSENAIPRNMETDTIPRKRELDNIPQNMENKKNEVSLNRDSISPKKPSDLYLQLTNLLIERILNNDPKAKIPKKDTKLYYVWANHIRLCCEKDGRDPEEIEIGIIFSQSDRFWRSNILSSKKLRTKLPTLLLQAREKSEDKSQNYVGNQQPFTKEDEKLFPQIDKEYLKRKATYMKKERIDSEDDLPFDFPSLTDYRLRKIRETRKQKRIKNENL